MKLDLVLPYGVRESREAAHEYAEAGVDGLWSTEAGTDPFLDLLIPAASESVGLFGTAVVAAFARSPLVTAEAAWQLQRVSTGRFALGLGTSVRSHVERRYGMPWGRPGPRMREYVRAVRSLWSAFRGGDANFKGEFYRHDLLPADFRPPLYRDQADPAVYLAAFNPYNCETVGRHCDGMIVHPFVTPEYMKAVMWPAVAAGLSVSGRERGDLTVQAQVFVITGRTARERDVMRDKVRGWIAHYGSTSAYKPLFELHGWGSAWETLNRLVKEGRGADAPDHVTEEMLETIALSAELDGIGAAARRKYGDFVDRILLMHFDQLDLRDGPTLRSISSGFSADVTVARG